MCLKNHLMFDHWPQSSHCFLTLPDLTRPALSNSTGLPGMGAADCELVGGPLEEAAEVATAGGLAAGRVTGVLGGDGSWVMTVGSCCWWGAWTAACCAFLMVVSKVAPRGKSSSTQLLLFDAAAAETAGLLSWGGGGMAVIESARTSWVCTVARWAFMPVIVSNIW